VRIDWVRMTIRERGVRKILRGRLKGIDRRFDLAILFDPSSGRDLLPDEGSRCRNVSSVASSAP